MHVCARHTPTRGGCTCAGVEASFQNKLYTSFRFWNNVLVKHGHEIVTMICVEVPDELCVALFSSGPLHFVANGRSAEKCQVCHPVCCP